VLQPVIPLSSGEPLALGMCGVQVKENILCHSNRHDEEQLPTFIFLHNDEGNFVFGNIFSSKSMLFFKRRSSDFEHLQRVCFIQLPVNIICG